MTIADSVLGPAPVLTEDNHEFWEAASEGRLVAQRCKGCGVLRHPPRPMCPECHSLDHEVIDLSGYGTVYSYSILHYPQFPMFTYPVVAVLVDLEEGVRILSSMVDTEPTDVSIGLPVQVRFVPTKDDMMIPVFVAQDPIR
jgi:uncharacterized OB-fold protein